jgi:putative PIN family toxin of toxin-antitoxin system
VAKPQIVLNTNVLVSALGSQAGASYRLFLLLESDKFGVNLSVPLVFEYEGVCKRLLGEIALTERDINDVIDYLCRVGKGWPVYYLWRPFLKDAKDDMILELAIAAGCDFIVTFNQSGFKGVEQFGIQVRTPKELLQEIGELP